MLEIKDYSMSDSVKKQLGFIIKEMRISKFQEAKNKHLIENNPFTKENFCENNSICHYHTLTKLESDLIKEDTIYHKLLEKLDLQYQVTEEEHFKNMMILDNISEKFLHAIEYIDDEGTRKIRNQVDRVDFSRDCIADTYVRIIITMYDLQMFDKVDPKNIELIESHIDFYEGIYKAIAYHCLGIFYYNQEKYEKSLSVFIKAKDIYLENNVSKGVINTYLIGSYKTNNNYFETVALSIEMADYFETTKNPGRLMHVYSHLSDYYLLINAIDKAEDYYMKTIDIINENAGLERYKFIVYYNWGFRLFKDFKFEEALIYFNMAYQNNTSKANRLKITNMLLMLLTKLNDVDSIANYVNDGQMNYAYGSEIDQVIFKYFNYKYIVKNKYSRRFALEKIIPILKNRKDWIEILLFFYEDLYK